MKRAFFLSLLSLLLAVCLPAVPVAAVPSAAPDAVEDYFRRNFNEA